MKDAGAVPCREPKESPEAPPFDNSEQQVPESPNASWGLT
jgi:hypothetical protein